MGYIFVAFSSYNALAAGVFIKFCTPPNVDYVAVVLFF